MGQRESGGREGGHAARLAGDEEEAGGDNEEGDC